jgi:ribosome-associated toxin RatA of RatAB toxin-antitoxin module
VRSKLRLLMRAPWERIFPLAAEVERWPQILPHYRYVRAVPDAEGERRFAMGARRGAIPVSWEAVQRPMPERRTIEFVHTGGVTKGMWVAWSFAPVDGGTEVSIEHRLELAWPIIGDFAARHVIGPHFIDAIAGRTLRRIRLLAEAADR